MTEAIRSGVGEPKERCAGRAHASRKRREGQGVEQRRRKVDRMREEMETMRNTGMRRNGSVVIKVGQAK